ncbi:erythroblast NAD(P)(+)--arginine ADP-ribosyltransferase-like [Melospiza georgiana]|uniref:erythroblast NAD(P)(+)--arginine ADP-ribosyltransferase-like n=1 Tax=Melospiza georgiana TaxID=44398 RepID=UPI0025AB962E|nr:erythroblast NAD(P)(+)--arginine ADP-ribosyltransferase-like [Melospiza georgiana]
MEQQVKELLRVFCKFLSTEGAAPAKSRKGPVRSIYINIAEQRDGPEAFSFYLSNREVLIPPYETFEIAKVTLNGKSAWISLRSTGTFSKYNCTWLVALVSLWTLFSMAPLALTLALMAIIAATAAITIVPLDIVSRDRNDGENCKSGGKNKLSELKDFDFLKNNTFEKVWTNATAEWQKRGTASSTLTKDQAIALLVYTMKSVYSDFNKAVRTAGTSSQEYQDNFHFKTLDFLLTHALQKLRRPNECLNVSRGVKNVQFDVKLGDKVRFGEFTSLSLDKTVAQGYGTDAIFEVHTCHGADIQKFSFNQSEKEVLIPPFETFEVTKVTREGKKVQIELRSTGTYRSINCKPLQGGSLPRNSPHLGGLLLTTVAMAVGIGNL